MTGSFDETVPLETAATVPGSPGNPQDPATPVCPPQIPEVTIEGELGRGGMGVVYRGRQTYLDRAVAIKVLKPGIGGEEYLARFKREAKLLAGLHHPHIVACYQAGTTPEGACYLVMEYIAGMNLWQHVRQHGKLSPQTVAHVLRDLAAALGYAQSQGIIHRDVKSENVLLAPAAGEGLPFTVKLVDLGLAKPVEAIGDAALTRQGVLLGTPSTMAPEQFDDPERVDHRADMYGLGCVAYHALTGEPAFRGQSLMELVSAKASGVIPDPTRLCAECPPSLAALVRRLLARSPEDRFATYDELIAACNGLAAAPARRRSPPWVFAGVGALVIAGMGLAWVNRGEPSADTPSMGLAPVSDPMLAAAAVGPEADSPEPRVSVPAAPDPSRIVWDRPEYLIGPDAVTALQDWQTAPGWGPAEEGNGLIGSSSSEARISRALPDGTWQIEGTLSPAGGADYHEAGILVMGADGPLLRFSIRNTGALRFLAIETLDANGAVAQRLAMEAVKIDPPWAFRMAVAGQRSSCVLADGKSIAGELRAAATGIALEVIAGAVAVDGLQWRRPAP